MQMMKGSMAVAWVHEMAMLCKPDHIHWVDGSKAENDRFLDQIIKEHKAIKLNPQLRPDSYAFFSDPMDVARVEERTFIASKNETDAGPTNHWRNPVELKAEMKHLYRGSMRGRTMYIIPFMMGPFGSPLSKNGIQITDSLYVVVNMRIMTRVGTRVLEKIKQGQDFVPCLHSVGYPLEKGMKDLAWPSAPIQRKYIAHFPEEELIWSFGSGYGGNALLGKKSLALRLASVMAKKENWMAEHMLILKVTNPEGQVKYMTGAFPSACGKTNLSMLVPTIPGWKIETIGDDIAWLWVKRDGRLYAINPEYGFFGVARGTSYRSNPNAMKTIAKNTIFTNVAITDDGDVWWEGIDGEKPKHLVDWQKQDWYPDSNRPAAHPNGRFTVSASQSPVIAREWEDPDGVPISAILLGGRRSDTMPLVHESLSWNHGVFMGSMMGSEITAATLTNEIGKVRRDPFAMLPFIGYHVGDYLKHWIDMGLTLAEENQPKFFYVNWFRLDQEGQFLWPGFGENARVLKWIFERCDHRVEAAQTPIGYVPIKGTLDLTNLNIAPEQINQLFQIDIKNWQKEIESIKAFYQSIGYKLPKELQQELIHLQNRLV